MIGGTAYQEVSKMGEATWTEVAIVAAITLIFFFVVWKIVKHFLEK